MHKLTIEDVSFKGKTVFVRVDFNVPLDEDGTIVSRHPHPRRPADASIT